MAFAWNKHSHTSCVQVFCYFFLILILVVWFSRNVQCLGPRRISLYKMWGLISEKNYLLWHVFRWLNSWPYSLHYLNSKLNSMFVTFLRCYALFKKTLNKSWKDKTPTINSRKIKGKEINGSNEWSSTRKSLFWSKDQAHWL